MTRCTRHEEISLTYADIISALLAESKRVYGNLRLIDTVGRSGIARSAWRLSRIMGHLGREGEARLQAQEASAIRKSLGHDSKEVLDQSDFDQMIHGIEQ